MSSLKLVVGLGNPGKEYVNTRHNVGFMVVDEYINNNAWKKKFDGLYQIIAIGQEKVVFLKPVTFMNLSGNAVRKVVDFYNISVENILVIQDDLDLPFGKFRLKRNSSSGGHNGIKSIISALSTDAFCRLKIGIGHDRNFDTVDYVLNSFSKSEMNYLKGNYLTYFKIIDSFISDGVDKTIQNFHS